MISLGQLASAAMIYSSLDPDPVYSTAARMDSAFRAQMVVTPTVIADGTVLRLLSRTEEHPV